MLNGYSLIPGDSLLGPLVQSPYGAVGEEVITTLWIGNVLPGTTDYAMAVELCPFGDMECCFLLSRSLSAQGQMSGFVRYSDRRHADAALAAINAGIVKVNGAALAGKIASKNATLPKEPWVAAKQNAMIEKAYLEAYTGLTDGSATQPASATLDKVGHYQIEGATAGEKVVTTLWIGNMVPGTTDQMLAAQLFKFGTLTTCFLMKSLSPQGQMSGFARFVNREHAAAALQAINGNQVVVNGSPVCGKFASKNCTVLTDGAVAQKQKNMLESAVLDALGQAVPSVGDALSQAPVVSLAPESVAGQDLTLNVITVPGVASVPALTAPVMTLPAASVPVLTAPAVTLPAASVPAVTVPAITVPVASVATPV